MRFRTAMGAAAAIVLSCSLLQARDWRNELRAARVIVPTAVAGTITGHVRDASGAPLSGFTVSRVDPVTRNFLEDAVTGSDGSYTFTSVPDGSYLLDAYGDPNNRLLDTWYPNVWDTDFWRNLLPASPVVVANGGTATADFRLEVGGRINVSLRDASGAPISIPPHTNLRGVFIGHGSWGAFYMESNGAKYNVNGGSFGGPDLGNGTWQTYAAPLNRTYYIEAWPQGSSYVPVYYDNKPTLDSATPIRLTSDVPVPITITLSATGASVSGRFTFNVAQDAINGSSISLLSTGGQSLQSVPGAADGTYHIGGVPPGDYFVKVLVSAKKSGVTTLYTKFYRNAVDFASATRVTVGSAGLSGIDVVMDSPADNPPRVSFAATPSTIRSGQSATLSWTTTGATAVQIDNGIGSQALAGSINVTPAATTTYTLTAMQGSTTVTSTATVNVVSVPVVNVTSLPAPMLQSAGAGGASTSYALANSGGAPASINLTQTGSFFTQSPASFTLQPGSTQVVTITASAQPSGSYDGASIPAGSGVPSGLQIPVKLLSAAPPTGSVTADPSANRVDVAAASGANPTGSVSFTNRGTGTLTGILTSDVAWIIPQSDPVTILPGQTVTLTFTIDRSKRPDASALVGSVEGSLTLSFLTGQPLAKRAFDTTPTAPSVTLVKVVDTVQSSVTIGGIPAIASGEVALFVPGVGHVTGTRGVVFASDVTLLNAQGSKSVDDVKMYYTPSTGSAAAAKATSLPSVGGQVTVAVADVVKNVFSGSDEVGSLQIRSKDADKLRAAATVLTTNNVAGTFGNTIPVFRSDRSIDANGTLVLTGLRKSASTHTNFYIQETGGSAATAQIDFLSTAGSPVSTRTTTIDAFKMVQMVDVVPANAVAAVITNTSTTGGKIAAYATPVDEVSSDTWAIADWSRQLGYAGSDPVVIPIAGTLHGANGTFYRTDLAITNAGSGQASGTLRYVSRSGDKLDRQITLGAHETNVLADVVGTLFITSGDSVGYLSFTPVTGSFAISSRTFTTIGASGTFGTGVPTIAAIAALKNGAVLPIAGLADAARTAVAAQRPGTFRTNFALMETSGVPAIVRVTFRFTFAAGAKAQGIGSASHDYALAGNQFLLLNSIASEILGVQRLQFGDLANVEADFQVIGGNGSVVLFTSSVDNATGDSILRTE